jgi:hypothetical protein
MRGGMTTESGSAYSPKQLVSAGPGPWSHNTESGSAEFGTKAGEYLGTNWARNSSDQLRPRPLRCL